ncbi:threonine/serine exporter family protein [Nonomuraea endophytica]|uniref:threonine/serine exporter family protein n=1 Tax=Nonomuraea endophytica TaxID=714136 RepID=UPI0037C7902C
MAREPSDGEVERAMQLLPRLGQEMFTAGSETRAIITALTAVAGRLGLRGLVVDPVGRSLYLMYRQNHKPPYTVLRVNPVTNDRDLSRLCVVYRLVEDLVRGRIDPVDGLKELERRMKARFRIPYWARLLGGMFLAMAVYLQADGPAAGLLVAAAMRFLVDQGGRLLSRTNLQAFYAVVGQAMIIAGTGAAVFRLGVSPATVTAAVAANLVLLLPVLAVVSLTEDTVFGYPLTAAYRAVIVIRTLFALLAGIAIVNSFGAAAQTLEHGLVDVEFAPLPPALMLLAAAVGAAGNVVLAGGGAGLLPVAIGAGMLAGAVKRICLDQLSMTTPMAVLMAAVALGFAATWIGGRRRLPATAVIIPGISAALLPGSAVATAILRLGHEGGTLAALQEVLVTTAAIGVGVVLGTTAGGRSAT